MTAIAERIDQRLRALPPEKAAKLESVIIHMIEFAEALETQASKAEPAVEYRLPVFSMGINPEIDMRKLGQLPDDF